MTVQYQVSNQIETELPRSEPLSLSLPFLSFPSTKLGAGVGDGLPGSHIGYGTAFLSSKNKAAFANLLTLIICGALAFVQIDSPSLG